MIFTKQNLILITMTVYIICNQLTAAAGVPKKLSIYNTSSDTIAVKMPVHQWYLSQAGDKFFYLQTFFKANWHTASEFCDFNGMELASVTSKEENEAIQKDIVRFGYAKEDSHFWISGNDQAEESYFVWGNGQKMRFADWWEGEPNNSGDEDCVEFWNKDKNDEFKWNDQKCNKEAYFICELVLFT